MYVALDRWEAVLTRFSAINDILAHCERASQLPAKNLNLSYQCAIYGVYKIVISLI